MRFCKNCIRFDQCNALGATVDFAVDDGVCLNFGERKPQTNADHIRVMSDGELAAHFAALFVKWRKKEIDTNSVYAHPTEFAVLESIYYAWLMEHFRQPVKDGEGGGDNR